MQIDFKQEGRLIETRKAVTDFLDTQVFAYPEYGIQIAGIRGAIVGICQRQPAGSDSVIKGSLDCDGSEIKASLTIKLRSA